MLKQRSGNPDADSGDGLWVMPFGARPASRWVGSGEESSSEKFRFSTIDHMPVNLAMNYWRGAEKSEQLAFTMRGLAKPVVLRGLARMVDILTTASPKLGSALSASERGHIIADRYRARGLANERK
jgi:hypothetical protein